MEIQGQDFEIEIEMTGLTRSRAAEVIAEYFGTGRNYEGSCYDAYYALDGQGRKWKVMSDASIDCQRKDGRRKVSADRSYSVELVSPICKYDDVEIVQELVRKLREAGAFVNASCGLHIHINAAPFGADKLRNLVNIMAAKEDMIYKALKVSRGRETHYCQKIDPGFLERLNRLLCFNFNVTTTQQKLKGVRYVFTSFYSNLSRRRDVYRHRRPFTFSPLLHPKRHQEPHSG